MSFARSYVYRALYWPLRVAMSLWHWPTFSGRENVPQGSALICCNHAGFADPVWVILALKEKKTPWIIAKKSLLEIPVLGKFLALWGTFGVDRDKADVHALKTALQVLRQGDKLVIFPEGTRVKPGQQAPAKPGALAIAQRTEAPVIPMYVTQDRRPFRPVRCVIGKPFVPEYAGKRPTGQELERESARLLRTIYALGEPS